MEPERARELLARERERIEQALATLGHEDTGEPADEVDPANLASELYQDELDEGLADDLRDQLAAVDRAEAVLPPGPTAVRSRAGSRFRTGVSKRSQRPSARPRRNRSRAIAELSRTRGARLLAKPTR